MKNITPPKYDLDKIKFSIDASTWQRAVELYNTGKIKNFKEGISSYSAIVEGTNKYRVFVEARRYDYGHCDCYLGQKNELCKHMVAVAIYAIKDGEPLSTNGQEQNNEIVFCKKVGELTLSEIDDIKNKISEAMRYIKAYVGPSRTWFGYQNSLTQGCNRLAAIFSKLPAGKNSVKLIIGTLIRLDNKLSRGGVDDSDGTVGNFIGESVELLLEFRKLEPSLQTEFGVLRNRETSFGWEKDLIVVN